MRPRKVEAVAVTGEGVFPTLKKLAQMVLEKLNKEYGLDASKGKTKPKPTKPKPKPKPGAKPGAQAGPPPAATPTAERLRLSNKQIVAAAAVLVALVAAPVAWILWPRNAEIPDGMVGLWTTADPRYADRAFRGHAEADREMDIIEKNLVAIISKVRETAGRTSDDVGVEPVPAGAMKKDT